MSPPTRLADGKTSLDSLRSVQFIPDQRQMSVIRNRRRARLDPLRSVQFISRPWRGYPAQKNAGTCGPLVRAPCIACPRRPCGRTARQQRRRCHCVVVSLLGNLLCNVPMHRLYRCCQKHTNQPHQSPLSVRMPSRWWLRERPGTLVWGVDDVGVLCARRRHLRRPVQLVPDRHRLTHYQAVGVEAQDWVSAVVRERDRVRGRTRRQAVPDPRHGLHQPAVERVQHSAREPKQVYVEARERLIHQLPTSTPLSTIVRFTIAATAWM